MAGSEIAAIVAAGGSGERFGSSRPKQFLNLGGKPLLAHTITAFARSADIDRVILVLPRQDFERNVELMSPWCDKDAGVELVPGGDSRQDSVWNGVSVLAADFDGWVLVHDGARPLVSEALIRDVVRAAKQFGGALAGLPVDHTLKEVDSEAGVVRTVDRRRYYQAQTPQCFRHEVLRAALERARADGFQGTDEAELVERMGGGVHIVPGSVRNLKVTTQEHLALAEFYLTRGGER
jgi:2-C-methyl-D-erythritol 4-phosphate cytidylyltransferase